MKLRTKTTLILALVLLGVGACTPVDNPNPAGSPPATRLSQAPVDPAVSQTRPPLSTSTLPPEPAITPTPTFPPTPTALPTLSRADAEARFLELIQNPDCRLPCFMGITPGQSGGMAAFQSLATMATTFRGTDVDYRWLPDGTSSSKIYYDYEFFIDEYILLFYAGVNEADLVEDIRITYYNQAGRSWIKLDEVLMEFGVPDDIYIYTMGDYGSHNQINFFIELGYREQGLYIYMSTLAEKNDNTITACFTNPVDVRVYLSRPFTSGYDLSFSNNLDTGTDYSRPVEAALEMDRETFTSLYAVPGNPLCLTTNADIWDSPYKP